MALTLTVGVTITGTHTPSTTPDLSTVQENIAYNARQAFTSGNTADTANVNNVWSDTRTLTGTTAETLDLVGSGVDGSTTALVNSFGSTLSFSKVKGIYIRNNSTTAGNVITVSGAGIDASNAADILGGTSPTVKIGAGGVFFWLDPLRGSDAAEAADALTLTPSASTTYDIIIFGVTA